MTFGVSRGLLGFVHEDIQGYPKENRIGTHRAILGAIHKRVDHRIKSSKDSKRASVGYPEQINEDIQLASSGFPRGYPGTTMDYYV